MTWEEYLYEAALMRAWIELMALVIVQANKPTASWGADGKLYLATTMDVEYYIQMCWKAHFYKEGKMLREIPPMPANVLYMIECKQEMVVP